MADHSPRRFRLRFGPGLALALLAIVLLWPQLSRMGRGGPPRIERARIDATPAPGASAPEPAWLLEQRDALRLSASQVRRLSRLRARWDRNTRALREALARASAEFSRSMAAHGSGRVTVEELQERAAPVSELSGRLAQARRAWWGEAAAVLAAPQRRRAEQAWAQRFARK